MEREATCRLRAYLRGHGRVEVETVVEVGDPAERILRAIEHSKADMAVVGTHGRRGPRRALLGSVAERSCEPQLVRCSWFARARRNTTLHDARIAACSALAGAHVVRMEQGDVSKFEHELDLIRGINGELKLQAHLAAAELRDEVRRIEKKWERLREELGHTVLHVEGPLEEIEGQVGRLVDELKSTFTRIRDALTHTDVS